MHIRGTLPRLRSLASWALLFALPALCLLALGAPAHAANGAHVAHAIDLARLLAFSGGAMLATNTLGNYNETFFAQEALIQLEKALGLAGRIYRDYSSDAKVKGDTIAIRRPSYFTATDAPATASNVTTASVSIVLNKWKEVKFALTDKDLALTSDRIITDHIRPAAVAIADQIDQDAALLYRDIPWHSTLTSTPVLGDISKIRKIMFDNKVPLRDQQYLHYMVDGATELAILNALAASGNMPNQQDPSVREASMGRIFGFETWANQNTPLHTSGVSADFTGTVDGVNAIGATTLLFSNVTAGITWKAGDSFSIAGDTQRYAATADGTDADGTAASITFTPGLAKATAGTEVITIFLGGSAKAQTLAFHRNAFALATAPLSDMGNQLGAKIASISDPITGIALRSRMYYMPDSSTVNVALDVLYGVKTLDSNLAVRGDAA